MSFWKQSAIRKQAEDILSLAVIYVSGGCDGLMFVEQFDGDRGRKFHEASAAMCVLVLRDVIIRAFVSSRSRDKAPLFRLGYDQFERFLCKAGNEAFSHAFSKQWRAFESVMSIRNVVDCLWGDRYFALDDVVHDSSVGRFLREFKGVVSEGSERVWREGLRQKIYTFCTRTHTTLDFSKWGNAVDESARERPFLLSRRLYDVFITYRRSDGLAYAQLLFQALDKRGYRCFLDVRNEQDGNYLEDIKTALRSSPNYIFLLTKGSLERLANAENIVYREIHEALRLGKKVIPVAPCGMRHSLYGGELLDEFNCLRVLAVSQLETGELFEASVDKIVRRFPYRRRPIARWVCGAVLAIIVVVGVYLFVFV